MGSERTSDLRLLGVQKNKQKKKCDCLTRSLALVFVFLNSFLLPWPTLPGSPHPLGPDPCWLPAGTAPCSASSSARLRAEARRGSLGRHNRKHNLPVGRLHPMIDFWAKKYFVGFFFLPTNDAFKGLSVLWHGKFCTFPAVLCAFSSSVYLWLVFSVSSYDPVQLEQQIINLSCTAFMSVKEWVDALRSFSIFVNIFPIKVPFSPCFYKQYLQCLKFSTGN